MCRLYLFIDFELGISAGLLRAYPTAMVFRCSFHLFQSIHRNFVVSLLTQLDLNKRDACSQKHGLGTHYADGPLRKYLKSLMALSLIDSNSIDSYYDELKKETEANCPANLKQNFTGELWLPQFT